MKYLFIDDSSEWLGTIRRFFRSNPEVGTAECHTVEDAMAAIHEHNPEVIFLDHHLTENGSEGLEVADQVTDATIYSTTSDDGVADEYRRRGITRLKKNDLPAIRQIIGSSK